MQTELDPRKAFRYARWLIMLQEGEDGEAAHIQWLQGNGMQQLTDPRLGQELLGHCFYNHRGRGAFCNRLARFLQTPVPWETIREMDDLSVHPECFRHFVATLLALQLPDRPEIAGLIQVRTLAASQLGNPELLRVVDYYAAIHDTAKMAEALLKMSRK